MKEVDQTIVEQFRGDCHRAVIASIFELGIEQVPNFRLYSDSDWFRIYYYFLYALGYEYIGSKKLPNDLNLDNSLDGYFDAVVKSKTFENTYHAVVIDSSGLVVHDPNPNKRWKGINVVDSVELEYWYIFNKLDNKYKYRD